MRGARHVAELTIVLAVILVSLWCALIAVKPASPAIQRADEQMARYNTRQMQISEVNHLIESKAHQEKESMQDTLTKQKEYDDARAEGRLAPNDISARVV